MSRQKGIDVVELDMSRPFNMARGRNSGARHLIENFPDLEYLKFVDGDCEVVEGYLEKACALLDEDSEVGLVTGHRRERYPEASLYNRLTHMDWIRDPGEIAVAGGDVVMRVGAYRKVDGFDETLQGAEDPDISVRLREAGYRIHRVDAVMTLHDIAMTRFSEWWRRTIRSGRDVAEMAYRHGHLEGYPFNASRRSNWLWGLVLPGLALLLAWPTYGLSVAAFALLLAVQIARIARFRRRKFEDSWRHGYTYGFFTMLGKAPCMLGQIEFRRIRAGKSSGGLIEYKAGNPEEASRD